MNIIRYDQEVSAQNVIRSTLSVEHANPINQIAFYTGPNEGQWAQKVANRIGSTINTSNQALPLTFSLELNVLSVVETDAVSGNAIIEKKFWAFTGINPETRIMLDTETVSVSYDCDTRFFLILSLLGIATRDASYPLINPELEATVDYDIKTIYP
jgi:hypothetical protein